MRTLAFDFSSNFRSIALVEGDHVISETSQSEGRSTRVFGLLEKVFNQSQWNRSLIETIAVGIGPGSYMGVRISIAAAQGWHRARGARRNRHGGVGAEYFRRLFFPVRLPPRHRHGVRAQPRVFAD